MVADSRSSDSERSAAGSAPETDAWRTEPLGKAELYTVIQAAVKDALLDVIGTVLLVAIAFVVVLVGGQVLLSSSTLFAPVIGLSLVVFGVYLAGATLEVIPPVRDWW